MRFGAYLAVAAIWLLASPAQAYLFCSEPDEPYCLDQIGGFEDEWEFSRCRDEVEQFVDETQDFVECLARAQEEADDAVREAIEKFNCMAEGNTIC